MYRFLLLGLCSTTSRNGMDELHSIGLHCIALDCIVSHCIALYRIGLHWIALDCIGLERRREGEEGREEGSQLPPTPPLRRILAAASMSPPARAQAVRAACRGKPRLVRRDKSLSVGSA